MYYYELEISHEEEVIESVYCLRSVGKTILLSQKAIVGQIFRNTEYN